MNPVYLFIARPRHLAGRPASPRGSRSSPWLKTLLFVFCLTVPAWLHAATISGTVKDPSGAVIADARIEITRGDLAQPVVLSSDGAGKFASPALKPGKYVVRVTRDGFDPKVDTIEFRESAELQLTLAIAQQQISISVPGKALAFANTDPLYRQLRDLGLGETFRFDDFTLNSDAATFQFQKGTLTMLNPVDGLVTGAIFVGEGHFKLKPVTPFDIHELTRRIGAPEVDEDFTEVVLRFTPEIGKHFLPGMGARVDTPPDAATVFRRWRDRVRQRREYTQSFSEGLLEGESMDNVDADILAALYNRAHPTFINAYVRGKKHNDLRYFIRARVGALPELDSPEEVALINVDPESMEDGVWYLAHLKPEYVNGTASSQEDRRLFATRRYKIETVIAKNDHLFSTATIGFEPLVAGERVLKFGLLPNLRVTRVLDEQGQNLYFIQESRKEDGSFYVILAQAPPAGKESSITVEYAGDKVLEQAGEGSFYVRARTSWYPNLNGFGEQAQNLEPDT